MLAAARTAYAEDPEAILALALPKLDFDDDGRPSNVDAILAALKKERPERFKAAAGGADGAKGANDRSAPEKQDLNALFRNLAGQR